MTSKLFTTPDEPQVLATTLSMPYTLTPGAAAGEFLAALADHRILGSRCATCERTVVPAQDVCTRCGGATAERWAMPHSGSIVTWTASDGKVVAKIRLDGSDSDLLHRFLGDETDAAVGVRVRVSWVAEATGWITDIEGFVPGEPEDGPSEPFPLAEAGEAISMVEYKLDLEYKHAYGHYYGRMFDELGSHARLVGSRCSACHNVLVPPRAMCDVCWAPTDEFVDVADTGVLQAFSVIHMEFVGQTRKPPYLYAEIVLDGSATRLIHTVGGDFDITKAGELLHIGDKVRAVWRDPSERNGTLEDIAYFEPVEDLS
jgi:uncharacterized OB-fold protein